jgi:hypothetical protein
MNYKKGAFQRTLDRTSLETKLQVSIEMASIDLITKLGYRENKAWTEDEDDTLSIICKHAKEEAARMLEIIREPTPSPSIFDTSDAD